MPISRRVVALLTAILLCAPAAALAQTDATPPAGSGVSSQPPVQLGGPAEAPQGAASTPPAATAAGELPNTGSDPRLLCLAGLALVLLGVGLRLRTADADLY